MGTCKCTSISCDHKGRCNRQLHHDGNYCSVCRSDGSSSSNDEGMGGIGGI